MHKRMTLLISALIIFTVILSSVFTIRGIRASNFEDTKIRLIVTAKLISGELEATQGAGFDYDDYARMAARNSGARVTVISPTGDVLGDSDGKIAEMENHFFRNEVQAAYSGKTGYSKRFSATLKADMLYVAHPLHNADGTISVVRVAIPMESVNDLFWAEASKVLAISFSGILAALLISHQFVNRILNPIKRLSAASTRIAEGEYGLQIMEGAPDEIGELTHSFNLMSDKLQQNMEESKASEAKTKAILSSMINGIIAVDNERRIMFINPVAETLLGIREKNVKGLNVMAAVRSNRLNECLEHFLISDQVATADIEVFEPFHRTISISTTPILSEDQSRLGGIILLQDVTEIRKLEQMRKDFVANVSHELKTPLTSIQGFVETLKAGAAEDKMIRERFLDILDMESTRLSALIDDLLTLSDIENRTTIARNDQIAPYQSVQEVVEMLSELAQRKRITLTLDAQADLPTLSGNAGWFKQMIINLVDNAIKYTPDEGNVHLELFHQGDDLQIHVSDTGIGIDEGHLSRLFERFYRVDKARSREVGGTGLGLAIVKHIVIAFGGQIQVQSKVGQGTEFVVTLPKANSANMDTVKLKEETNESYEA